MNQICCNKIQKTDLVSSLPNNLASSATHPYKNHVYTKVCKPECLVKASFHTVIFWNQQEITCVQDQLSQPECLVKASFHTVTSGTSRKSRVCSSQLSQPECLVKASFHTVISGTSRNHVFAVPSCPSQNVLCF
jgi:hypothetical protein